MKRHGVSLSHRKTQSGLCKLFALHSLQPVEFMASVVLADCRLSLALHTVLFLCFGGFFCGVFEMFLCL